MQSLVNGGTAVLVGVGLLLIGVPNALLWGGLTIVMAFVPLLGTPLVWVPICIWLWFNGHVWQAIVLAVYASVIVSSIDNFLRPWILAGLALSLQTVCWREGWRNGCRSC
jgi:predicted PurR-regulated permease PerM